MINIHTPRIRKIISMVRLGRSLRCISNATGYCHENVRQIIQKIKRTYGAATLEPSRKYWTIAELCSELKESRFVITKALHESNAPYYRQGNSSSCKILVTAKGRRKIRRHLRSRTRKHCRICERVFLSHTRTKTCSLKCRRIRIMTLRHERTARSAHKYIQKWHKDFLDRLKCRTPPQEEQWVTLTDARLCSDLSLTQLRWLASQNLVSIRPHPTKKWRGKQPVTMYAVSEIMLAGQAYKQHRSRIYST